MTLSTSKSYIPHRESLQNPSSVDSSSGGSYELLANVQINPLNSNNNGRCSSQSKLPFSSKPNFYTSLSSDISIHSSQVSSEIKDNSVTASISESYIPQSLHSSFSTVTDCSSGGNDDMPKIEGSNKMLECKHSELEEVHPAAMLDKDLLSVSQAQNSSSDSSQVFQVTPPLINASGEDYSKSKTDWSRSARKQRLLLKAGNDPEQMKISDYFDILNDINNFVAKNQKLNT